MDVEVWQLPAELVLRFEVERTDAMYTIRVYLLSN